MSTNWNFGELTGIFVFLGTNIDLSNIEIYKIEVSATGNIAVCFFKYINSYYIMFNYNFLSNQETEWDIIEGTTPDPDAAYTSTTSWTSDNNNFYVYYTNKKSITDIPYIKITPLGVLSKGIITPKLNTEYIYNDISISFNGKYLCAVTTTNTFILYPFFNSDEQFLVSDIILTFIQQTSGIYINPKYISASNNLNYNSFVMITSENLLYYVYNFSSDGSNTKQIITDDSLTTFKLLSNFVISNDVDKETFYTVNDKTLYTVRIGTNTSNYNIFKSDGSFGGNNWSCLKQRDANNAIMTTTKNIFTFNQGEYYRDDISDVIFTYCAISGIDDLTEFPYMLCGVDNSNFIYYSINGGGACFIEKTKITIFENCKETQKNIEYLKKGDLVKTSFGSYKKIAYIGYNKINVLRNLSHIMVMDENTLNSNEKLFLTSGHSVLFENYDNINEHYDHNIYDNNIMNGCKIMTQHCKLFKYATLNDIEHLNKNNFVYYYHIVLENENLDGQYGVYANNVLCETMSINFIPKSGLIEHNKVKCLNIENVKSDYVMI
jgi:hypothetical protein